MDQLDGNFNGNFRGQWLVLEEAQEEKKEDGDDEEDIEGKRRNKDNMQDTLAGGGGWHDGKKKPWSLLPLVSFPCSSCFKVLSTKKKLKGWCT